MKISVLPKRIDKIWKILFNKF